MNKKNGQQEMVGFVLIVVLVVIGLMVFLVISVTSEPESVESSEVDNLLGAVFKHTTDCAIQFEPEYDDFGELFKSCYEGKTCKNLGVFACDYLNESLRKVMEASVDSMADVNYYILEFSSEESDGGYEGILRIEEGVCTGSEVIGAIKPLVSGGDDLIVSLRLCRDS